MKFSEFSKNVATLMTGTAIAQAIPIIVSPVLTRMYSPEDFGLFTIFISIVTIGNTIVTGRYEVAMFLPKKQKDAVQVLGVAILIALIISSIILVSSIIFNTSLTLLLKEPEISPWLYLTSISIFLMGVFKIFYAWLNRKKDYKTLASGRINRSIILTGSQLGIGLSGWTSGGLIIGQLLGELTGALWFSWQAIKKDKVLFHSINKKEIKEKANRYIDYPKFSLPADLINVLSNQLPIFLFSIFFGATVVGLYGFTYRIMAAPISILAGAILDVFKEQASKDYIENGTCRPIFISTLKKLFILSIVPFIIIGISAPSLFEIIFGEEWRVAGEYAQILSVLFFIRFIVSPLSYVLYITEQQKVDFFWQIGLGLVTGLSLFTGIYYDNIKICLWAFSISYSLMYLIYLALSYKYSETKHYNDSSN